jgi:hypothetical protein
MSFSPKTWLDRPEALDPLDGETVHAWLIRCAAAVAADPEAYTPLDAAALVDLEERLSEHTDDQAAALSTRTDALESDSEATTPYVAVVKEGPLNIMWPEYGATMDNVADDGPAWLAALAALPAEGGEIHMPRGISRVFSRLDVSGRRNVRIVGEATENDVIGDGSCLIFAGTGSGAFIDATESVGFEVEGVNIAYASNSFTGYLIDYANRSGSGANDTRKGGLERVTLSGTSGSWTSPAALICLANAVDMTFTKTRFQGGTFGVIGRENVGDYSNCIRFDECDFGSNLTAHVKNAGDSWIFDGPVIEGLKGDKAGFYTFGAGMGPGTKGMVLIAPWMGDVLATGGLGCQMNWSGAGLTIIGGLIAVETATVKGIVVAENNCGPIHILGTQGVGPGSPMIDYGATTGHDPGLILPGTMEAGMAVTAGTIPGGTISHDTAGKLKVGAVTLYQDGAANGLKTDGYLAAAGNVFGLVGSFTGGTALSEQAAPAAAPDQAKVHAKDVGGKTALMVQFPTGLPQQIAIEP